MQSPSTRDPGAADSHAPAPGLISVVIPCYRSERSIGELVDRLAAVFEQLARPWQAVLVDDRSPDGTWGALVAVRERHGDNVTIARMARNVGQHAAICSGFTLARGEIVVTMDDDLQNPPEEIPKLIAAVEAGADIAIAGYDRKKHAGWRNTSGGIVDATQRWLFGLAPDFELTSFRATTAAVIRRVNRAPAPFPYVTALLLSNALRRVNVAGEHRERPHGASNYNLKRSFSLVLNLVLNYSPLPLYAVIMLTSLSLVLTTGLGTWVILRALLSETAPGWASLITAVAFVGSQTMLGLLAVLIYVSRINQALTTPAPRDSIDEVF